MNIKHRITHNLLNVPGWRTKRHIVVFESDDWGAIRMPSREIYEKLQFEGYRVDKNIYERTDSLARENDLMTLLEVLKNTKTKRETIQSLPLIVLLRTLTSRKYKSMILRSIIMNHLRKH